MNRHTAAFIARTYRTHCDLEDGRWNPLQFYLEWGAVSNICKYVTGRPAEICLRNLSPDIADRCEGLHVSAIGSEDERWYEDWEGPRLRLHPRVLKELGLAYEKAAPGCDMPEGPAWRRAIWKEMAYDRAPVDYVE